jgi:predicted metalloenzyme YecM
MLVLSAATRFIYANKGVLHRDISEGNVLVKLEQPSENMTSSAKPSSEASVQTEGVKAQPYFIEHILNRE